MYRLLTIALLLAGLFSPIRSLAQVTTTSPYAMQEEKNIPDELRIIRGDKLRGYHIAPDIGMPQQVQMPDTITHGTWSFGSPERRSIAVGYLGNSNSSWQSKVFFDRDRRQKDFVYLMGYQGLLFSPDKLYFYDTKTPFSFIRYSQNFDDSNKEEQVYSTLSTNLGPSLNLGLQINHTNALGYYDSNRSKNTSYRLFGSYRSDHYDLSMSIGNDYFVQAENGGVTDMDYLTHPERYSNGRTRIESKDVPVLLQGKGYFNILRSGHAYLSHHYKLGYHRRLDKPSSTSTKGEADKANSVDSTYFVPIANISHTVYYNQISRRSASKTKSDIWETALGTPTVWHTEQTNDSTTTKYVLPNDSAQLRTLHNSFALSLMEGFRPWVKFGLSAYLRTENTWYYTPSLEHNAYNDTDKAFSSFVGGVIDKTHGDGLLFRARGEFGLVGRDLGATHLEGAISTRFSIAHKIFGAEADALVDNSRPPYFASHHHSTYGWWDKDLNFTRRLEVGGRIKLESWGTTAEARTATLQNYIYWDANNEVQQYSSSIQVLSLRLDHSYKIGPLGWSLAAAWQKSTQDNILPLPQIAAKAGLYCDLLVARVLRVQLGVDAVWHSAYYAPYYHPSSQQFILQQNERIGGDEPLLNAYANFRLKRTRFFIKMFNLTEVLMSSKRLSIYKYPYNPTFVSAGVVMDFAN